MQGDEEIAGAREQIMQYHRTLSDSSHGLLPFAVLSLWLETSCSTANPVKNRSQRQVRDLGLYVLPNIPPILSSSRCR